MLWRRAAEAARLLGRRPLEGVALSDHLSRRHPAGSDAEAVASLVMQQRHQAAAITNGKL
jgi:hypothetical protein